MGLTTKGVEREARRYLTKSVPQIQEHGGNFEIRDVDEENGQLTVAIGGACSGCCIAPMTMEAIEHRLPEKVDGVSDVTVVRAGGPSIAVMPSVTEEMEEMDEYESYSPPF
jgi:Fe-S cluster biogenesis protein NfuA